MASTDLATLPKTELVERAKRWQGSLKRVRESLKDPTKRGTQLILTGAGGFAAGALETKVPDIAGIPSGIAVGLAAGLAGAFDMAGEASEHLLAFGSGMVAGSAYNQGREFGAKVRI